MIERRDDDEALLRRDGLGPLLSGPRGGPTEDDFPTLALDALDLDAGSVVRHDDHRPASEAAGGEGYGLAMIAAGVGDDPGRPFGRRQKGNGVVGASGLEGTDWLLLLALEVGGYSESLAEGGPFNQRCPNRDAFEPTGGLADRLQ